MTQCAHQGAPAPLFSLPQTQDDPVIRLALTASRPAGMDASRRIRHRAVASAEDIASRAPMGRHFPDNPQPSDHVLFLHGDVGSNSRWVCLRRLQPKQEQVSVEGVRNLPSVKVRLPVLLQYIDQLVDEPNLYLAQADYFWGEKGDKHRHLTRSKYLNSIGTIFVDLDIYNASRWDGVPIEQVAQSVRHTCVQAGIPEPIIIGSGRGLYANWKFETRVDLRDPVLRSRWERLQRQLMALLHDFAPDPKVRDATRILRLVGTINPRSGTRVEVLHDDGAVHAFDQLEASAKDLSDTLYAPCAQKTERSAPKARKSTKRKAAGGANRAGLQKDDSEPLSSKEALDDLRAMLEQDKAHIEGLNRTRRYQYQLFRDIATVVLERGGIAYGSRDEFVFWLLVMRFNAGLYGPDELQGLATRFAGLTQGCLNLWDAGMLVTLHARMTAQTQEHGQPVLVNPIIRRRGKAFAAVRSMYERSATNVMPLGHGAGFTRPMVYTPKASTLVERLGITGEEQTRLESLISPQERLRRDRANSASTRRQARNDRILSQAARQTRSVQTIARRNNVSVATAYRILSKNPEVARQNAVREKELSNKRAAALTLLQGATPPSMRAVASLLNVSVSTVHRWAQAYRQSSASAAKLTNAKRVDQAIRAVALQGRKRFPKRVNKGDVLPVTPTCISKNTPVPLSQNNTDSMKGIGATKGEGLNGWKKKIRGEAQKRNALPSRRSSRFYFSVHQNLQDGVVGHCDGHQGAPGMGVALELEHSVSDFWTRAQSDPQHMIAMLETEIPEIPGMQDDVDVQLEVIGLYSAFQSVVDGSGLALSARQTINAAFEMLLLNAHELDDANLLDQALCLVETVQGQELLSEAFEGLRDILKSHQQR